MDIYNIAFTKDLSNFRFKLNNRILILIGIILFFPITAWSNSFDANTEGFTYSDDTFYNTKNSYYASGSYDTTGGFSGGGLKVSLGGINNTSITNGMSGGWSKNFNVDGNYLVNFTLKYRLIFASNYESDECGQALIAIDGVLAGPSQKKILEEICGNGNGGSSYDSGWKQASFDIYLANGQHNLTVGGWNNKKTYNDEVTNIYFDDIIIKQNVSSSGQPPTLNLVANPSSGQTPLYVTFESNASDPDGNIVEYRWDYDGNGTVDDITPSNPVEFIYITPGTYNVKVEVVDNDGLSTSDSVAVKVSSPPQPTPTPTPNPTSSPSPTTSQSGPTFYISPTGSNSSPGTSDRPWKTFKYAIPKLLAGDSLILMDGTYTKSTTGLPYVSCGSRGSAKNGTATKPITIKAKNERQAFLSSDGSVPAFKMQNCSYWNIEGLRLGANDFNTTSQISTGQILSSNNINIRKILVFKQNRLSPNSSLFAISSCDTVLVEDSEFYASMRHLLNCFSSQRCTFRRVYANARDFKPAGSSTCPFGQGAGQCADRSVVFYGSSNSIMENVIVEGNDEDSEGMQIHSTAKGNKILGSISLNAFRNGMRLDSRGTTTGLVKDTIIENYVAISTNAIGGFGGLFHQGAVNTTVRQATILNTHGPSTAMGINLNGLCAGCGGALVPTASFLGTNILVANNKWSGIYLNPKYPSKGGWDIDYPVAFNQSINFNPAGGDAYGDFTNEAAVNPALESCMVYIPSSSPMKGWGKSREDIGANIIYRYGDGVLTDQKLWNQTTGQFPCGATVTGVNDNATFPNSACVNVHKRLNVGVNGCPIP